MPRQLTDRGHATYFFRRGLQTHPNVMPILLEHDGPMPTRPRLDTRHIPPGIERHGMNRAKRMFGGSAQERTGPVLVGLDDHLGGVIDKDVLVAALFGPQGRDQFGYFIHHRIDRPDLAA